MEKDDIKKLVLQAAQGNKAAFGALYEETGRTVYFSCLKLLGDPQLAEDITQETYLTALQKLGTLAQPENFPAWVNRIGINLCKMHFRNNAAPEDNSEEIIEEIPDEGFIPEEYVSNDAKRKIIMDIIDTVLTEEQRRSVILYYFDMLTVPEIAEVMNCTTGTVTSRLSAARKKIKEAVLIYEENNNDRLHAVVPVFILSKLLNKEASNTVLPKLTVFTGSASAANAVPDSVTSTKTISGGKVMFSTVKAKVIAGVCAVAVVGGGITAVVMANRNSDDIETDTVFSASSVSKSESTKQSEADSSTSGNTEKHKDDIFWIDNFEPTAPTSLLAEDTLSSIGWTLPMDYSKTCVDGKVIGADKKELCLAQDIFSCSEMINEGFSQDIKIENPNGSTRSFHIENFYNRQASIGQLMTAGMWKTVITFSGIVDTENWEHSSYQVWTNKDDINQIFDVLGMPTSIYYNNLYDNTGDMRVTNMYWENPEYTLSTGIIENKLDLGDGDVTYYYHTSDFDYFAKGYPQDKIHETDGEAIFTTEFTGITDSSTQNTEEEETYDLEKLDLTSDATPPEDMILTYGGSTLSLTKDTTQSEVAAAISEEPVENELGSLGYGETFPLYEHILDVDFSKSENSDIKLTSVRLSFETQNDYSLFGISMSSTPQDIAAIMGTPRVVSSNDIINSDPLQRMYWTIPKGDVNYKVTVEFRWGKLDSIGVDIEKAN